jgi:intein/homing endonuclease
MPGNPFKSLLNLYQKPELIPAEVTQVKHLSPEDKQLIHRIGLTTSQVRRDLLKDIQIQWDRMQIYHQVERCLRGDTKIWLLDGTTPTIQEMAENPEKYVGKYTLSIDPVTLKLEPDEIVAVQKTRLNAELVRVHLDNGKYVDCTCDHPFMLRSGAFKEAQNLQPNDSLMPLYLKYPNVVRVEQLQEREDTYDITTKKNHNFPVAAGVFLHNSLEHPIVGAAAELYGNYCCLTGDTRIPLLDGRTLTIQEIFEEYRINENLWVYSCDYKGKPQPAKILHAIKQDHKPNVFRIWLDNEKYVDTSDNHRFIKRDGSLCRADELKVGDSLMPFHGEVGPKDYERVEIVKIEVIGNLEVYDLTVDGSHLFGLDAGIYVHNTVLSPLHNSTCWVTSDSPTYQRELTKLLDRIGVEESIFDWAYSTGTYGDLFIKINGIPGKGIISVDDNEHPLMTSRVDHEGSLIGYYKAPLGQIADAQKLIPPWDYVHFRLLGGKKKRPRFCLRGNTQIRLLNGTSPTIQEMAENPDKYAGECIFSINPSTLKLEVDKIVAVQKTRLNAKLVKVRFNCFGIKKCVECTPDHKFLLGDNSYREAKDLQPGDNLRAFLIDYSKCLEMEKSKREVGKCLASYSVVNVEEKEEREDTYDITTEKNHNFLLDVGIFVHNSDPMYTEFRTMHLLTGMDIKQVTTKYGTSLLMNALPCYRRLRLAEDSLLLARLSRGLIRYVWKLRVSHCLRGNTKISLMDGTTPTIQEMAENPIKYIGKSVNVVNKTTLTSGKIRGVKKTRLNAELVRVYLDNDKYVDCTPDHKFLLWFGDYIEARKLSLGTVLYSTPGAKPHLVQESPPVFIPWVEVVKVEKLSEREDTYDIEINDQTPNFPLEAGVFVHNSSMEAVGELVDQYSTVLREARALNTRPDDPGFEEKENPMSCLRGNTQIMLCNGQDISIQEMAENQDKFIGQYVWTMNPVTWCVDHKRILAAMKTRQNATLLRVCIGNGTFVDCTQDHKFMLRDGSYKEAQHLQIGEILMRIPIVDNEVTKIEWLPEKEDVYDITVEDYHNFVLSNGIFVHNCIEDIFLPVWDNVGDLTYDKIGGEADIRWIKDVEDLRQQLAAALRCPLPLLGAYLKEASGPLGSEIIEKVDINFARIARKLQRTVRNGIKRICQIHLAWMNMDPDPNLFDIQMPEMSTAEEESLKDSLNSGTDVIAKFMSMMDDIEGEGGKKIDRVEVFNYLNEKILKLEDFDLTEFMTSIEAIPECKRRSERKAKEEKARGILEKAREVNSKNGGIERKGPQFDTDLFSYVPTTIYDGNGKLYENRIKKFRGWLGKERCMHVWESKFSQVKVIPEGANMDVKQGQKLLPFTENVEK